MRNILINEAIKLAKSYFKDKKDKGGKPYMNHMFRIVDVIQKEKKKVCSDDSSTLSLFYDKAIIVAMLHDILEDTECTVDVLKENKFDDEIITAVIAITRKKEEQFYFDYIERVKKNDLARFVKVYDIEDNMDVRRLNIFGDYEMKRLKKYWYSWKYLMGEISSLECNNTIHPNRLFR